MVMCKDGMVMLDGKQAEILAETTCILASVYANLKEIHGENAANETLAHLGRLAVADDFEKTETTIEL